MIKDFTSIKKNISKETNSILKTKKTKVFDSLDDVLKTYKEEYKYSPLLRKVSKKFDILRVDSFKEKKKNIDKKILNQYKNQYSIITINGLFQKNESKIPNGISVNTFDKLNNTDKKFFHKFFNNQDDSKSDIFTSINTINYKESLLIKIDKNYSKKDHVNILNFIISNSGASINHIRKLIVSNQNSKSVFIEEFISLDSIENFSTSVTEIIQEENSEIEYLNIQNDKNNFHFNSINISQKQNSISNCFTFSYSGALVRNNLNVKLKEKNCYSNMYGFYALREKSHVDNHTTVDHIDENSISNEHYKGIMDNNSNGVFNGKIFVRRKAQKTNAFQSNNNILLSDEAKINTKPQLEIWADDVKCSHGCTVGQLDKEAIFYLQSRGISKEKAISMLLGAFSEEIIEKIENQFIKEKIKKITYKKLEYFTS
ncbi:MAG TPA: Fe-S cluster assembly protein SufD [Cytophagales bacterium]|nr:Fe-S cluster assembly protein SufD [Cytophagales bacterium]